MSEMRYQSILKEALKERCERNPNYSLRAFSKFLGISPSSLSEILNGKQGLSEKTAKKICERLAFNMNETDYFVNLVLVNDSRSKKARIEAQKKLESKKSDVEQKEINEDSFKFISDWYHYALLELLKVKNFKNDYEYISKKLGITRLEAESAVQRLKRLNLIKIENGKIVSTNLSLTTKEGLSSDAIRKFNKQILSKAIDSLTMQTTEERDVSTVTFAVPQKNLPIIKDKINKLRKEIINILEDFKDEEHDEVYMMSIQVFRLSEKYV